MVVYRFKPHDRANHRVALTTDRSGANLPRDGAPWEAIGQVDLASATPWVNVPVAEIEKALGKVGYFIWSITVPELKTRFQRASDAR